MSRKTVIICVLLLFASGLLSGIANAEKMNLVIKSYVITKTGTYTPHTPIRINNDTDPLWASYPGRTISGYDINGTGYGPCIFIGNCSQLFTVQNCFVHNATGNYSSEYYYSTGIYLYNCSNGTIRYNNCSGTSDGVGVSYSINTIIWRNNCTKNTDGIIVYTSSNITVDENDCQQNYNGIFALIVTNSTFTNNTLDYNQMRGIHLDKSNWNAVTRNHCFNNYYGISMSSCLNTSVLSNNCSYNHHGIYTIVDSENNLYQDNSIFSNSFVGFTLTFSRNCRIINNTFYNNNYRGIYFERAVRFIVVCNNISHTSKYGLEIFSWDSRYNRIYYNRFINNNGGLGSQAYEHENTSFWNASYPYGGNFWNDWISPDVKSGPSQNQAGSDGIVDQPYQIDGPATPKDYYPLVWTHPSVPEPHPPSLVLILMVLLGLTCIVRRNKDRFA